MTLAFFPREESQAIIDRGKKREREFSLPEMDMSPFFLKKKIAGVFGWSNGEKKRRERGDYNERMFSFSFQHLLSRIIYSPFCVSFHLLPSMDSLKNSAQHNTRKKHFPMRTFSLFSASHFPFSPPPPPSPPLLQLSNLNSCESGKPSGGSKGVLLSSATCVWQHRRRGMR